MRNLFFVVGFCFFVLLISPVYGQAPVERRIVLGAKGGESCVITNGPVEDILRLRSAQVVRWFFTNDCDQEIVAEVGNFVLETDGSARNPVNLGNPVDVLPGETRRQQGVIKPDHAGAYLYDILVNGQIVVDPRLEVDR